MAKVAERNVKTRTELKSVRQRRAVSAAELARAAGVSRQTIYAIEDGSYVPNTAVALRLAHALQVRVDDLFRLDDDTASEAKNSVRALLLVDWKRPYGAYVRVATVAGRLVAVPVKVRGAYFPVVDGKIVTDRDAHESGSEITVECDDNVFNDVVDRRVVIAGCDPGLEIFAELGRQSGIDVITLAASSGRALSLLRDGCVHVAGSHLFDRNTGKHNLPALQHFFPEEPTEAITFAHWQLGFAVRAGNPKGIRAAGDLAKTRVSMVNREAGSGSRDLLDTELRRAGIDSHTVLGYERIASGHLAAASAVASGRADCAVVSEAAALAFGLEFIALEEQRFDLCVRSGAEQSKPLGTLLDRLSSSALRSRLKSQGGYDCSDTGTIRRSSPA